jgi:hypothetical protein
VDHIMKKLFPIGSLGLVGLLGAGLLAIPGATVAAPSDGAFLKRDEDVSEVVLVADDDDDDTNDKSRTQDTRSRNTGASRSTRDHTRSNFTKMSRDRDLSRGDKTRDWTRDGGDRTRDHSQNRTNDRSRNDTRR